MFTKRIAGGRMLYAVAFLIITIWNHSVVCKAEIIAEDDVMQCSEEYTVGTKGETYLRLCRTAPTPCGSNKDGVSVQRGKCTERGGTVSGGTCPHAFEECCKFKETCSINQTRVDVNQLVTVLESPTPANTDCTFRFKKEKNVCQIRLDFQEFDTAPADKDGRCVTDRLRIQNSITIRNDFTTCGKLTDQHMYLTFGGADSIDLVPMLTAASSRYKIVATKIPCNSVKRAPDYCLQYYTTPTGTVKSFDFGVQQQDNQQYTVCVKPTTPSSMVKWKPCQSGIIGSAFDIVTAIDPASTDCTTDWIQVKGQKRFCQSFPEQTSPWKPYELLVNFDGTELPPPPASFTMPVNLTNCEAECISMPPIDCFCLPQAPDPGAPFTSCQCIVPNSVITADFENKGFCLEYTQI